MINDDTRATGVEGVAAFEHEGDELTKTIRFVIPYTEWGLKNPSTFMLHIGNHAQMEITTSGRLVQGKTNDTTPH